MEHSITPTVAEFRAQVATMNSRAQEDSRGYERDQRLIALLRLQLAGQRNQLINQIVNMAPCECSPAAPVQCSVCDFVVEISRLRRTE